MTMVHQIDKDVVRTDRSHPYYQGDENTHVGTLKYGGSQYTCRVMYHRHGLYMNQDRIRTGGLSKSV